MFDGHSHFAPRAGLSGLGLRDDLWRNRMNGAVLPSEAVSSPLRADHHMHSDLSEKTEKLQPEPHMLHNN